jgi:hypothetical protein
VLERVRAWIADGGKAGIAAAVHHDPRETAEGEKNYITIDHLLPEPGRDRDWRFRVTTVHQVLPNAHFDRAVRAKVNQASRERGRRIYALERDSLEVMAVLSYHLDEGAHRPLLITALGTRCDADGSPELFAMSLALVWLLKQYAHVIAEKAGRGAYVDMDASTKPEVLATLERLGFRNAPRVKDFTPSGKHLRQDALNQR